MADHDRPEPNPPLKQRVRALVDKARNETQKSMFLCEVARIRVEKQAAPLEQSKELVDNSKKRRDQNTRTSAKKRSRPM